MSLKLFAYDLSPAVRATLLTIKALGIDVELVNVNLAAGEHLQPSFLKLNPLHTIPTLQDGDFVIYDSHVINGYLADKYGKEDSLYPADLQKRALVQQQQHFDNGVLFPRLGAMVKPLIVGTSKTISKDKVDLMVDGYNSFEKLLEGKKYVAGDSVTIADFSLIATVTSANTLVPIASNRYPNISEWIVRMQALPYYAEANQVGLDKFAGAMKKFLS